MPISFNEKTDTNFISDVDTVIEDDPLYLEAGDKYVGMEVNLPHQGEMKPGRVTGRKRTAEGNLLGTSNKNPFLDTRQYEVAFLDGTHADYSVNVLVENIYNQVEDDGRTSSTLKDIIDHKCDSTAIPKEQGWLTLAHGSKRRIVTTKGWKLKVQWEDGSSSWIPLSTIKEANPIETAEYARLRGIDTEPVFAWWSSHVLRRRQKIISKIAKRISKGCNMKFGITIPTTVDEALRLDRDNGNDLWKRAIDKELKNVKIAFQPISDDELLPVGSKKIPYHIIFDVKFDLSRKARLVAGGHRNPDVPSYSTYSSVVSRDTVRLSLLLAALNDLELIACDIGNAYLNAPCREKVHVILGAEIFGEEFKGKRAIIVRALYGLKSAGASWRTHFSNFIQDKLKYFPCQADPDVYMKPKVTSNGRKYYSYLVIYVDDVLCIDENPEATIKIIGDTFRIKEGSTSFPKMYLGANVRKWTSQGNDGVNINCYALGSESYVREAIRIVEIKMKEHDLHYSSRRKCNTPFSTATYRPELESSPMCNDNLTTLYQNLIGILRWSCELGRVDILLEVSLLSQYMSSPRMGHLIQACNIFKYLKNHDRSWIVLNPDKFEIEWEPFKDEPSPQERAEAMKLLYPDVQNDIPPNAPEERGQSVQLTAFVDSDHAGNVVTRRSHTGILVFVNMAPILFHSKRQNVVESSTFGSEFVALKNATELVAGLRYKLTMMGVPIDGPTRFLCDNESVVKNGSFPESVLKKKHCSIAYHVVRQEVAAGKSLIYWESTSSNLADLFTKVLTAERRFSLIRGILH